MSNLFLKIKCKILFYIIQKPRIYLYSLLSSNKIYANKIQPVLVNGIGSIKIHESVTFGVKESAEFYSGYSYIDAKRKNSYIEIEENCIFNNCASIISDGKKIIIKKNCLIGSTFQIIDSDFHDLSPKNRFGGKNIIKQDVLINENVFIGNNVTILKGVTIGKDSVIGNGSVVTKSIPKSVIAAGNPARIIKKL